MALPGDLANRLRHIQVGCHCLPSTFSLPSLDIFAAYPRLSLPSLDVFTACPRRVRCLSSTFSLPFLGVLTAFPGRVRCLPSTFSLPVLGVFAAYPRRVRCLSSTCSLPVLGVFRCLSSTFSLPFLDVSLPFLDVFAACPRRVRCPIQAVLALRAADRFQIEETSRAADLDKARRIASLRSQESTLTVGRPKSRIGRFCTGRTRHRAICSHVFRATGLCPIKSSARLKTKC